MPVLSGPFPALHSEGLDSSFPRAGRKFEGPHVVTVLLDSGWERVTEDRRDMGSPVDRLGEPWKEVKCHSISRAVLRGPKGRAVSPPSI